jgi:HEAT repeat protein
MSAARALVILRCDQKKAIPVLIEGLADTNPFIRIEAALHLGSLGAGATSAVPALVKALRTGDPSVRFEVENALVCIDPVAAVKAGVNTNAPGS